jgi:hypothetical protein
MMPLPGSGRFADLAGPSSSIGSMTMQRFVENLSEPVVGGQT